MKNEPLKLQFNVKVIPTDKGSEVYFEPHGEETSRIFEGEELPFIKTIDPPSNLTRSFSIAATQFRQMAKHLTQQKGEKTSFANKVGFIDEDGNETDITPAIFKLH